MTRQKRRFWYVRWLIILGLGIILYKQPLIYNKATIFASYVLYPILVLNNTIVQPIQQFFQQQRDINFLQKELQTTLAEKEMLLAELIQLKASTAYMQNIKEVVDFKKRYTCPVVVASVLLKQFTPESHFFLVDAGSKKNITVDMVAVYKNCLIGRVTEVYPYYSKILLITDPHCPVSAQCYTTNAQGIHKGTGNLYETEMNFVSHLEPVQEHDLVISSGQGLVFPKGFGLGRLKSYKQDGFCYRITIEPLVDMARISTVALLQKGAEHECLLPGTTESLVEHKQEPPITAPTLSVKSLELLDAELQQAASTLSQESSKLS